MMRTTFLATLAGVASAQKIDPLSACCKQTHPLSSPVVALDTWVYFTDNIGSDNWNTRVTSYEKACCPKPADCPGGVPKVCSEKCATIFQPFYRDCFKTFDQQSQKNMIKVHKLCGDTGFITVALGAHNGVRAHNYVFKIAKLKRPTYASYSSQMIRACSKLSMKPVCDHPSYCRADDKALYIGNDNHIAYKPHRNTLKYHAKGWERIKDKWVGLCSYTGSAGGSKDQNAKTGALCNIPVNTHAWKTALQSNPGFVCGKAVRDTDFKATLGGTNGAPARAYEFHAVVPESPKGSYSSLMIKECKKLGMKPVCDHPSYCRNDAKALWIGQRGHLAYPGHRNNNKYVPSGFQTI